MKNKILIFMIGLSLGYVAVPTFAETKAPKNVQNLIPNGWHSIDYATGDLNNDKVADHVIVIEENDIKPNETTRFTFDFKFPFLDFDDVESWDSTAAARKMLIFFGDKDGKIKLAFEHSNWIGRADQGGMMGDSYDGIQIDRGSILISAYGGSRQTWGYTLRVRYQQNAWRMIGFTYSMTDRLTTDSQEVDINLLNFKANKKTYMQGILTKDKWYKLPFKDKIYLK